MIFKTQLIKNFKVKAYHFSEHCLHENMGNLNLNLQKDIIFRSGVV